jgi:stalled ribosome alternative rescue factor ArfA
MQPCRNAIRPGLRDLMALMLEHQWLYSALAEKRAKGRGHYLRRFSQFLAGRSGEPPLVANTISTAHQAASEATSHCRGVRRR